MRGREEGGRKVWRTWIEEEGGGVDDGEKRRSRWGSGKGEEGRSWVKGKGRI